MFVRRVGIVGAGTMGGEIAQVCAAAGLPVVLCDVDEDAVRAGVARARTVTAKQTGALVERGKLDQAAADARVEEVAGRIEPRTDLAGLGAVDLVVEAVPERLELKQEVFAALDAATPGRAVLATNTSALPIAEIGAATTRPELVVGLHFFWPAATMRLVEVVEGDDTAAETVGAMVGFAQRIKKTPIRCLEAPGFVVNRVLGAYMAEAMRLRDEQGLEPEAVDSAVTEAELAAMGPFRVADMSGLRPVLAVAEHLHEHLGDRFPVSDDLRARVAAGDLGRATGKGFHTYD